MRPAVTKAPSTTRTRVVEKVKGSKTGRIEVIHRRAAVDVSESRTTVKVGSAILLVMPKAEV